MNATGRVNASALSLLVMGLCLPVPANASEADTEQPQTAGMSWEGTRRLVRQGTEWLVRGVDGWFGDKPFSEGGAVTDGRLSVSLMLRQNRQPDFSLRLNADLRMPNADQFGNLFLGRDDPRDIVTDKPEQLTRRPLPQAAAAADRVFFAGVGVNFSDRIAFRLGFRGGLKPYAQVRYRQSWQLRRTDAIEFQETLFLSVDDVVGSTTALTYEHEFSPPLVFRWLGAATITQRVPKFEWSNSFGLYRSLGDQRLLTLEALTSGLQDSGVGALDYGLQVKWQQPVHQDWLLGEATFGHFWPRPNAQVERSREWGVGGRLIMKF